MAQAAPRAAAAAAGDAGRAADADEFEEEVVVVEIPHLAGLCHPRDLPRLAVQAAGENGERLRCYLGELQFEGEEQEAFGSIALFEKDDDRRSCHFISKTSKMFSLAALPLDNPEDIAGPALGPPVPAHDIPPPSASLPPVLKRRKLFTSTTDTSKDIVQKASRRGRARNPGKASQQPASSGPPSAPDPGTAPAFRLLGEGVAL